MNGESASPETGKPSELAPASGIHAHPEILEKFVFDVLEVSAALVSDRSTLSDFLGRIDPGDMENLRCSVITHFGVDPGPLENDRLHLIVALIARLMDEKKA